MKIKALLFLAVLFIFSACSYEPGISEAFSKYRFKDGVTTITVPGWAIGAIAGFADIEESEQEILESIDLVKVITIEDADLNERTDLHKEFYTEINKNNKYEELLVVREETESVTVFGCMKENVIREMVILVGGDDNAMVYIKGEIEPDLFSDMIDISNPKDFLSLNF